jgi:hypothetical protein
MPESRYDLLERLAGADFFARMPGNFAESPEDKMDAFSEILSGVKLNGAVFFTAEFSAPWGFSAPASKRMERGDRLKNPVVRPAVVFVEQLNVIFSHSDGGSPTLCPGNHTLPEYPAKTEMWASLTPGDCPE